MPGLHDLSAASAAASIHVPHVDYLSILPMLIMMGGALVLMTVTSLFRRVRAVGVGTTVVGHRSRSPPWWRRCSSGTTVATHGPRVTIAGAIAFDGFDVFIQIVVAIADAAHRPRRRRLPPPRGGRRPRVPRAGHDVGIGGDDDGGGQRPHRDLPRPRDPLHRPLRAGRLQPQAGGVRRGRPSSTSCSAPSPRPSSSTASPSSTGRPDRPTFPRSPTTSRRTSWSATACSSGGWPCCSSASASRSPPSPSTCGRPTSTRVRPPRSPGSWRRSPRPARSPGCSGCSSRPSEPYAPTGSRSSGASPSCPWWSGRWPPWSSGT